MPRTIGRLTALKVSRLNKPGRHADGGGLHLQISPGGARSWIYRYMLHGRARDMGLGPVEDVTLAEARDLASAARKLCRDGIDPIDARKANMAEKRLEAAKSVTFDDCAAAYVKAHGPGWTNPKHAAQWTSTLERYVSPVIGKLPVQAVDTAQVLKVLEPIWKHKTETAGRVRGRLESVLDWAGARGYRGGENPARWKNHLSKLLPARSKVRAVRHHPSLPYAEVPAFMADLRKQDGTAARALEFSILTAARTGEVIGTRPGEINQADKTWVVPAERMKARKPHRVPLSPRAIEIVSALIRQHPGEYVFPGARPGRALSNMAMLALLKRMKREDITAHGFRSSFRDWCAESTNHPREVAEAALAHTVESKTEAAYRRGDVLEKRRRLMADWARYCTSPPPKAQDRVVPMRKRR